jgi:hypothetical protein
MMTKSFLGASAVLLIAGFGGWLWNAAGNSEFDRASWASELREHLHQAQAALLGAHVDLYERDYFSAARQLENARELLRRAVACAERLGWSDELTQLDLASFEADIDEAQRLLSRLGQGSRPPVPRVQVVAGSVLGEN